MKYEFITWLTLYTAVYTATITYCTYQKVVFDFLSSAEFTCEIQTVQRNISLTARLVYSARQVREIM